MAEHSDIEWTDSSWNPVVGCSIVSPGCTNCYAMKMAARIETMHEATHYAGTTKKVNGNAVWTGKLALAPDHILTAPLRWKKPRRIFVNSMGDLFHEDAPDEWIDRCFAVMALAPQHTFQILTKRPERMKDYFASRQTGTNLERSDLIEYAIMEEQRGSGVRDIAEFGGWPLPQVWLGVSAERQKEADERIPILLQTPAAIHFVSLEPLLGPIDLMWGWFPQNVEDEIDGRAKTTGLNWVIVGGESGSGARPMHPDWARAIRDKCKAAGASFLFKQYGAWAPHRKAGIYEGVQRVDYTDGTCLLRVGKKAAGRLLDGRTWDEFPEATS